MTIRALVLTLAAPLLATGCALFQPPPLALGQSESEVTAMLGSPTGRYPMPDGVTRLEFARGPFGRHTWMVDLGPDGRSRKFDQVLTTEHFAQFAERAPGMSLDDLLRTLGRPGDRQKMGWVGGEVWSWRYPTNDCLWFQVSIGDDRKVINGGYGIDPMCDVKDPPARE
jgi:hypothetical protein